MSLFKKLALGLLLAIGLASPAVAQQVTQCVTNAQAGGTVNAITVPLLPCGLATNLLILTVLGPNTADAPTLQMTGFAAQTIKNADGSAVEAGTLPVAGGLVLLTSTGTGWRLLATPIGGAVNQLNPSFSLLSYIPQNKWACLRASTCITYDTTSAFATAKADMLALYSAGVVGGACLIIPQGTYPVTSIDWNNDDSGQFSFNMCIQGAGTGVTRIVPTAYSATNILLSMIGRNNAAISDLTIDSSCCSAQAGIVLARSTLSGQCNGNSFTNVDVIGAWAKAGVVSIACENTSWHHNYFRSQTTSFWTGTNPANIGLTINTGQTLITSANTANQMFDSYFYSPYANATPIVFSTGASYSMHSTDIIASGTNAHMVTYTDQNGGSIAGQITWISPHFEGYASGVVVHYINCGGTQCNLVGFAQFGGAVGLQDGNSLIDFDRTNTAEQPILYDATITNSWMPPGNVADKINLYGCYSCNISFTPSNVDGTLNIFGLVAGSGSINSTFFAMPASYTSSTPYTKLVTAVPATGTWARGSIVWNSSAASGQPQGWMATGSGTLGTLNGGLTTGGITSGTNTLVVNSATGLALGQAITITGVAGVKIVRSISGTTVKLDSNAGATVAGAAVAFSNGTFAAMANLP